MKPTAALAVVGVALLAAGSGYWLGSHPEPTSSAIETSAPAAKRGKLLYYRNPMGLPDTSPVPKKDPMGMDYLPVYEGEEDNTPASANQIRISVEKVQKLGVRTEPAVLAPIERIVSAAGRIEPDERRVYTVAPKFEGYVERQYVNVTGQPIAKGQPLFEVYGPELVSAQREYAIAMQGLAALHEAERDKQAAMREVAESSLQRLRNWDISEEQIKVLANSGEVRRTLILRSPVSGVVTEKKSVQGMRFMPGETLYQVADLSSVWVVADVPEQDVGSVSVGAKAKVSIDAYPDKAFEGTVSYVYPTLKAETRTVPVRIELANPGTLLKPGMFARVETRSAGKARALTIPASAVIDSGTRRIILIQAGEGRFEPREVKTGIRSGDRVEVLEGVREDERAVVAANFLIDAESNLKAAVGGFGHAAHGKPADGGAKPAPAGHSAAGKVEGTDAKAGTVSIAHGPVADLKWPAMTMEFKVANDALMSSLKPGAEVSFEFVERAQGEWVITRVTPASGAHAGH
ncbi:MAG TPA: efflux RND transporter periplasmic adaptor subunit [Accumulibacter sp.]|uniref:efflux RND transporter periplasmic adaptor subunit n=1 Tax=Accumulibacter sp. TaxID=2053492 RepID=UPI0025D7573F|nr:efflux RND transporter periplasmic adaptor subunit [Accumulibacter sp.]MCM8600616.1 efflux RND transporter periplasmic adaptor subunit [Accumulibacter sp.]MCM8664767.1 efflux RND transporter periplasmic adaptor subunit [Accumulibacter sp.]HNC52196.1 efflux RND transporter periplasmic adaptor subunit [Accumulibacter sp.]HNO64791.1 efflux RND transporter periplasmic adaptor subunit [Tepidiformaceae bacterium]